MWYLRISYAFPEPSADFIGPFDSEARARWHQRAWAGPGFDVVRLETESPTCLTPAAHIEYMRQGTC
jgi:hypothetical protein